MIVTFHYIRPDRPRPTARVECAQQYADCLTAYQDRHRALMFALRDDDVSVEAFERINDEVRNQALELKQLRLELKT